MRRAIDTRGAAAAWLLAAFLCLASGFAAKGQATSVISVQFGGNDITTNGLTAGVVPETVWNGDTTSATYFSAETTGINNLKDSTGAVNTGLDETKTDYGNYGPNAPSTGFANAGDNDLFSHGPFTAYGAGAALTYTLNITGLSQANTYDLIVYTYSVQGTYGASNVTATTPGGTTYYYATSYASQSSYIRAASTSSASFPVANYVEWTGLTPASGAITASLTTAGNNGLTANGFQLVVHGGSGGSAPSPPTGLSAGAGNAQVALNWTASSGATSYNVYRGTSPGGESATPIATGITATTDTDALLTNGTTYYYTVAAVNSSGTSAYSNEANATPGTTLYPLTVNDGAGSGSYAAGAVVNVSANAPASGYQFAGWTGATGALANPSAASTTLTMPAAATAITATYAQSGTATYSLTVTSGSGSNSYPAGTVVNVSANAAPNGYQFAGWTGVTSALTDPALAATMVTMPAGNVSITATYFPITNYPLAVNGGTGTGSYAAGTVVTVAANAPAGGYQFARWTGATSALLLANADSSTTTMTMPAAATTITASYGLIAPAYAVTVNSGSGSGTYAAGTVLTVAANPPATSGSSFAGWSGSTGALGNAAFSTTTLTVPASPVTITATYATVTSSNTLTVTSGSGSGSYAPGAAVPVTANAPASGYQFSGWSGSISALSNPTAPSATLFMPSGPASITANYTAISATGSLVLAVGLERIVPGYAGPAIRIQRPVDNAQEDIGFASGGNLLDTAAVTAFLGQAQGYITTLYDQSGGGNNLTTPQPTSTASMPTISVTDPTTVTINGVANLTARNIEQEYQSGQGSLRYFVLPPGVSVNKSQMSAFLAYRGDYSGSGSGDPYMSLYEVGNPTTDAVDIYSCGSGFQGLTHNGTVDFINTNIFPRSQSTVVGLVTAPSATPVIYLDGVSHPAASNYATTVTPASTTCSGGYLMAGTGTALYYGGPFVANYNFLAFALYSGSVSPGAASSISGAMIPRTVPTVNIVADGDSITQGTGSVYGYDMLHYLEPLLNEPADITDIAIYGTTSPTALGHATSPTPAASADGMIYNSAYAKNIYYVDIGTNDIHGGFADGATTWATVVQALQGAKALGYITVVTTVLHEYGELSGTAGAAAGAQVDIFNSLARSSVGQPYLDAIIDYEADARLGNLNNYYPAYSGDGTHPNDAGYQVMSTIAAPVINALVTSTSYTQWAASHFMTQQLSQPAVSGQSAAPQSDGVTNLLKYLCDVDPSVPMDIIDWAALPASGMATVSGSTYLTLTYRQNPTAMGLTVQVQTSTDLQSWQTVTPTRTIAAGTDPVTGDTMIQVQVPANPPGVPEEFIRLNVIGP